MSVANTAEQSGVATLGNQFLSVARFIISTASRDTVAKLRLGGAPTPRSWVVRMTKRPPPHRCRQERLPEEASSP